MNYFNGHIKSMANADWAFELIKYIKDHKTEFKALKYRGDIFFKHVERRRKEKAPK